MPGDKSYQDFLKNRENKADLLHHFTDYIKRDDVRKKLPLTVIFTLRNETWEVSSTVKRFLHSCNHEEADLRIMLHCQMEDAPVIVIAKDTDILVILVYSFALTIPNNNWFLQTDKDQYVNISAIHDHIGNEVSLILPSFFTLTGCDTVSYFFRKSKKCIFDKVLRKPDLAVTLLDGLGKEKFVSTATLVNIMRFIQLFVYGGKDTESLVETRIRNYDATTVKTTDYITRSTVFETTHKKSQPTMLLLDQLHSTHCGQNRSMFLRLAEKC